MALSESLVEQSIRELNEVKCAGCGGKKEAKKSFCWMCYGSLPKRLRNGLYQTGDKEYATAYEEAKDFLKING